MPPLNDKTSKPVIAVIIPTYNEESNIAGVLKPLTETRMLSQIIIVDDGSDDGTVEIARDFARQDPRIQVIVHGKNKGKGQAIHTGWAATSAPYLLLLDGDLHNLTSDHILALLSPVINHDADMTLGLFLGGHLHTDFSSMGMPFLTGQRALQAEILKHISWEAASGYGFEVALTIAASQRGFRRKKVILRGVWHPPSEFHRGGLNGLLWRFRMYGQILHGWLIATRTDHPRLSALFSNHLKQ